MKQCTLSIFLLCYVSTLAAQTFSLKGTLTDHDNNTRVYLMKMGHLDHFFSGSNQTVIDSAIVQSNGDFEFKNAELIEDNTFYRLNVIDTATQNPGAISMFGSQENFAFFLLNKNSQLGFSTGSKYVSRDLKLTEADQANRLIQNLRKRRNKENEYIDLLIARRNELNRDHPYYKDSLRAINTQIANSGEITHSYQSIITFADTVSNPWVSLLAMQYIPIDEYGSSHKKMNERYQREIPETEYSLQYNARLNGTSSFMEPGTQAPGFTLSDKDGSAISLSSLRGKYVLIDFWASWCHPCRNENVEYVKPAYERFRKKGFTVLSISLDLNRDNWLNAIKKDGTSLWYNVCDMKGQASPVVGICKVHSLPCNYLIGPNGTIIAVNLRGNALEKTISKHIE